MKPTYQQALTVKTATCALPPVMSPVKRGAWKRAHDACALCPGRLAGSLNA